MAYGELIISAMNSAFEPRSGPRNSTLRSPASDRSSITSIGCLPSASAISPTLRPTYCWRSCWRLTPWMTRRGRVAADAGLDDLQAPVGLLGLGDERRRSSGSCIFSIFSALVPVVTARHAGRGVVEVPVLEREREPGAPGGALGVDRQALGAAPARPTRAACGARRPCCARRRRRCRGSGAGRPRRASRGTRSPRVRRRSAWVIWIEPSSRSASTSARARMSSSPIVSVTIGVPSKSACTEFGPRRWIEKPARPASMPSCSRRCISLRSWSVAGRRLRRLEAHHVGHQRRRRHVLDDVDALRGRGRASRGTRGWSPSPTGMPWRIDSNGIASVRVIVSIERSRKSGAHRREAEAAVAEHDGRDAVPAGDRAPRVPADLGVVVGVAVDEARRDDLAGRRRSPGPTTPSARPPICAMRPSLIQRSPRSPSAPPCRRRSCLRRCGCHSPP